MSRDKRESENCRDERSGCCDRSAVGCAGAVSEGANAETNRMVVSGTDLTWQGWSWKM